MKICRNTAEEENVVVGWRHFCVLSAFEKPLFHQNLPVDSMRDAVYSCRIITFLSFLHYQSNPEFQTLGGNHLSIVS